MGHEMDCAWCHCIPCECRQGEGRKSAKETHQPDELPVLDIVAAIKQQLRHFSYFDNASEAFTTNVATKILKGLRLWLCAPMREVVGAEFTDETGTHVYYKGQWFTSDPIKIEDGDSR